MRTRAPETPRETGRGTYVAIFALFATVLLAIHLPWLTLPYYWDEAGQYIPAALDVLHGGALIPHSVPPILHPPGVMVYLAAFWKVAGYAIPVTRIALLLLSALGLSAAFLLAIELSKNARGMPAFLAAGLVCLSPLFVSQSMLANLDGPAMTFTTLALLLFLQERIRWAVAACLALVLVKETGLLVPLVFALWLLREKRWRDAVWFAIPAVALGVWIAALKLYAGHWAGTHEYLDYNLFYPLHPVRLSVNLARRFYYLFGANLHWVGAIAIVYAWRKSELFQNRAWRIAGCLAAAHVALVTALGGAVLERYLLPALPVLYAAMAAGLSLYAKPWRVAASLVLLGGVIAGNFINPPYPFPYENNLSFTDFTQVQRDAAGYVEHWYPHAQVTTIWPLSIELAKPELGYVTHPIAVQALPNLTESSLARLDWHRVQVLIAYPVEWDPRLSLMRMPLAGKFWERYFDYDPAVTQQKLRAMVPFPPEMHIDIGGQWADIYVNPTIAQDVPTVDRAAR